ncbi:MAG: putative helicase/exonuclease [Hyperionvirus sp.]|uniref:Putative helicase/exonuclease n=1 Tax=Hyperionvirus sp. TaxID=2487770 RepID=A0A3G5AFG0_9VIRU|nr:MAG: putative helicase/exonuclease [Hyperionvirus sp.]
MILPQASLEQSQIVKYLATHNVIVDSCAGAGKTTCVLHVASHFKRPMLLLTYNKKLKFETRDKKNLLGLHHLDVHSYHSCVCRYYDHKCYTDREIINVLKSDSEPKKPLSYEYIIIDESQDMTSLYFQLVYKIIRDNSCKIKMCILGDHFQSIYDFNGADPRFIIHAEKLFKSVNEFEWKHCKLSISYRLTNPMAKFINTCVLKQERLGTVKDSKFKVRYLICDCFGDKLGLSNRNRVFEEVKYYLQFYSPEDIFVLAPSVKSDNCPARQLANKLSEGGVMLYVPNNDDEKLDEDILRGKLVFSTFHQAKGMERKVVIVFSFDDSYFQLYKKDKNPLECANELYVALTRSSERLTVLHHYQNEFLQFIDRRRLSSYCEFEDDGIKLGRGFKNKPLDTAVTDLTRHVKSTVLEKAMEFFEVVNIQEAEDSLDLAVKTEQENGLFECVSEITGIAIPAYFELKNRGRMTIYDELEKSKSQYLFGEREEDRVDLGKLTPSELLLIANNYCSFRSGYIYKLNQIKSYDWLSKENLDICVARLGKHVGRGAVFEKRLQIDGEPELYNRNLLGNVDCIDGGKVFEFKCVGALECEHFIQLAVYYYMNEMKNENAMSAVFMNRTRDLLPAKGDKVVLKGENGSGVVTRVFGNGRVSVRVNGKVKRFDRGDIAENSTLEGEKIAFRYYLYNILTNEMYEIRSSIGRLKKMMDMLIFNKYMIDNRVDDATFLKQMIESVRR